MDDPTPKPTPGGLAQYLNDAVATPHRTSEQVSTALKVWAFDWFLPTIRALRSYQELLDSFAPEAMVEKMQQAWDAAQKPINPEETDE